MIRSFARRRDGSIEARLSPAERDLLVSIARRMRDRIGAEGDPSSGDPADPALRRLFPPAYEDDLEAQSEYARFTSDELRAGKVRAIDAVIAAFGEEMRGRHVLDAALAQQLLGVLNDARLTLGTELDVTEDPGFASTLEESDVARYRIYEYLGWLEEQLVQTLDADT